MKRQTFYKILEYLTNFYNDSHKNGSRKGTVCDCIKWVEDVLGNWDEIQFQDIKTEIEKAKENVSKR